MAELLGEIAGTCYGIYKLIKSGVETISENSTEVIGLADSVKEPVDISKGFLGSIFPNDVVVMFGIAFTVILALAMRRSTTA